MSVVLMVGALWVVGALAQNDPWTVNVERCDGAAEHDPQLEEQLRLELPRREKSATLTARVCESGHWELRVDDQSRKLDLSGVEPRLRRRTFALLVGEALRAREQPAPPQSSVRTEPALVQIDVPPSEAIERRWELHASSRTYFDQPVTLVLGLDARVRVWWRLWLELRGAGSTRLDGSAGAVLALLSAHVRAFELPVAAWRFTVEAGVEGGLAHTTIRTTTGVDAADALTFGASAHVGFSGWVSSAAALHLTLGVGAARGVRVVVIGAPQLSAHGVFVDLGVGVTF